MQATALLVAFASGLIWQTAMTPSRQLPPQFPPTPGDSRAVLERLLLQREGTAAHHLAKSIRFRTISHQLEESAEREFDALLAWIERTYKLVFSTLLRTRLDCHSLLLEWPGRDRSLKPFLLASHLDVVPIDNETQSEWLHDPFSGDIDDGFLWGRGTLDDKIGVIGILEAVEALIESSFVPQRSLFLAFGHDEEVSGHNGALKIVKHLGERNVSLEFVLDEGGVIAEQILKQVSKPVALVGIAEKGYVSIELVASGPGGHSSMPTNENPIGILAEAVAKIQNNPMPSSISGATMELLAFLAPEADSFAERVVLSNLWLFNPIVKSILDRGPSASSIRTSSAITLFNSGVKDNVLPKKASATVNFRTLPGETPADCIKHIAKTANDPRVSIHPSGVIHLPSPVSPTDSDGWYTIQATIQQLFPDVVVAPYLTMGATDGRHYHALTDNVYRFIPYRLGPDDLARIHGINERVAIADVSASVRFYGNLILNAQKPGQVHLQATRHAEL